MRIHTSYVIFMCLFGGLSPSREYPWLDRARSNGSIRLFVIPYPNPTKKNSSQGLQPTGTANSQLYKGK